MIKTIVIAKIFQSEQLLLLNNDHCFCKFVLLNNCSILQNYKSRTAGFKSHGEEQEDDVSIEADFRTQSWNTEISFPIALSGKLLLIHATELNFYNHGNIFLDIISELKKSLAFQRLFLSLSSSKNEGVNLLQSQLGKSDDWFHRSIAVLRKWWMILHMKTLGLGMHFVNTSQVHVTNHDVTTYKSVDTKMSNTF